MNILFIDNFDSFIYNLVDEFQKRSCNVLVYRNNTDMALIDNVITQFTPKLIVISPGPSTPRNAGICIPLIQKYYERIPIFGVCLGHQCIVEAFNGKVSKCKEIVHGKPSLIQHDGKGIFNGMNNPLQVGRYHSLAAVKMPLQFELTAHKDDIVMAIRHKQFPVIGVQFHPESILTPSGGKIIENILEIMR